MARREVAPPVPRTPFKQHRLVHNALLDRILSGQYPNSSKLPTQEEICREFNVSRPTVIHALDDLKSHGHIRTVQGSGAYVSLQASAKVRLGLIIPGTAHHEMDSVFPMLQQHIMQEASRLGWQLMLEEPVLANQKEAATRRPVELARQFIRAGVRAAIFTPHEVGGRGEAFNNNVLAELAGANVPVVLLDRDVVDGSRRSSYDLVCIDNFYGGQIVGKHLVSLGVRRVVFVQGGHRFPTPGLRLEGLRHALDKERCAIPPEHVFHLSPHNTPALMEIVRKVRPDAIVCNDDYCATLVMKEVLALGLTIPGDIKMASFDDAPIARLLPVGLTTMAQPVEALAFKAVETLRDRSERPDMPPVTVQVQCKLVVRESTRGR